MTWLLVYFEFDSGDFFNIVPHCFYSNSSKQQCLFILFGFVEISVVVKVQLSFFLGFPAVIMSNDATAQQTNLEHWMRDLPVQLKDVPFIYLAIPGIFLNVITALDFHLMSWKVTMRQTMHSYVMPYSLSSWKGSSLLLKFFFYNKVYFEMLFKMTQTFF